MVLTILKFVGRATGQSNPQWVLSDILPLHSTINVRIMFFTITYFQKICLLLLISCSLPAALFAAGPASIAYEGFLRNSAGDAQTGVAPIYVRLYDAETGGSMVYEELHPNVPINEGYFSVQVGSVGDVNGTTAVDSFSELLFNQEYYLTTEIGEPFETGEMTLSGGARAPLVLAPYSYSTRAIPSKSSAPTSPVNQGQIYYDTTEGIVFVYSGNKWIRLNGLNSVSSQDIKDDAVVSAKILDGTISLQDLAFSLNSDTVTESSNLYFTTERARNAITAGVGVDYDSITGAVSLDTAAAQNWLGEQQFSNSAGVGLMPYGMLSGNTTMLKFGELAAQGINYIGFKAPDSIPSNVVWVLPSADGVAGEVLATNGLGQLSWNSIPAVAGAAGALQFNGSGSSLSADSGNLYWDDANNRLGVGTSSPQQALTISQGNILHTNAESNPTYYIGDTDSVGGYGFMQWQSSSDMLSLGTQLGAAALRISESNRVGINTDPLSSERVAVLSAAGDNNVLRLQRNENSGSGLGYITFRRGDGVELGYLTCNLNTQSCGLFNASDRRIKQDIMDTDRGIDDLMNISIKDYKIIGDTESTVQQGVIAQELYDIFPQAVVPGDSATSLTSAGKTWVVDYTKLTPLIIRSIQEQQFLLNNNSTSLITALPDLNFIQDELARGATDVITEKISKSQKIVSDFIAGRMTAVRGYFDQVDTKTIRADSVISKELCVTEGIDRLCINRDQLQYLLNNTVNNDESGSVLLDVPIDSSSSLDAAGTVIIDDTQQVAAENNPVVIVPDADAVIELAETPDKVVQDSPQQ